MKPCVARWLVCDDDCTRVLVVPWENTTRGKGPPVEGSASRTPPDSSGSRWRQAFSTPSTASCGASSGYVYTSVGRPIAASLAGYQTSTLMVRPADSSESVV